MCELAAVRLARLAPVRDDGGTTCTCTTQRHTCTCVAAWQGAMGVLRDDDADRTTDAPRGLSSSAVPRRVREDADRFFVDRLQVCSDLSINHDRDSLFSLIIKLSDLGAQGRGKLPIMRSTISSPQGWSSAMPLEKTALCEC